MAKKPSKPPAKKMVAPSSVDHRTKAAELRARARLHEAKAEMIDVKNPPKPGKGPMVDRY